MNSLKNIDCTNKKVLLRVDLNIEKESLLERVENLRLTLIKKSVSHILQYPGSTVTLITHFGRPLGMPDDEYSTAILREAVEATLQEKISFTNDCLGEDDLTNARIALRENLRFYPEEEANDFQFAKKLGQGFDLYVNEAFSVCHRKHASVVAITEYLPTCAGINLEREIEDLHRALSQPTRPAVAILGGAKIETKLPLIRAFEKSYDTVLLGGIIANEALDRNISFHENVFLPIDFRGGARFDIGDKTVEKYREVISGAKTILWNGPLGKFEEPPYHTGTFAVVEALRDSNAYLIAGGGESLTVIEQLDIAKRFNLLSSGGGAMLAYLGGESLPGLEALK